MQRSWKRLPRNPASANPFGSARTPRFLDPMFLMQDRLGLEKIWCARQSVSPQLSAMKLLVVAFAMVLSQHQADSLGIPAAHSRPELQRCKLRTIIRLRGGGGMETFGKEQQGDAARRKATELAKSLRQAAERGNEAEVRSLLDQGAEVN
eukprot:3292930-Rhodomonas_salina.1